MEEFKEIVVMAAAVIRSIDVVVKLGWSIVDRRGRKRENPPDCGSQTDRRIS